LTISREFSFEQCHLLGMIDQRIKTAADCVAGGFRCRRLWYSEPLGDYCERLAVTAGNEVPIPYYQFPEEPQRDLLDLCRGLLHRGRDKASINHRATRALLSRISSLDVKIRVEDIDRFSG
jgi:hypothetical protein